MGSEIPEPVKLAVAYERRIAELEEANRRLIEVTRAYQRSGTITRAPHDQEADRQ